MSKEKEEKINKDVKENKNKDTKKVNSTTTKKKAVKKDNVKKEPKDENNEEKSKTKTSNATTRKRQKDLTKNVISKKIQEPPKKIKEQGRKDDEKIKQIIAEQLSKIEKMEKSNKKDKNNKDEIKDIDTNIPNTIEEKHKKKKLNLIKDLSKKSNFDDEESESRGLKNKSSKNKKYNPEEIAQIIENKQKLPKEEKQKIYKKIFINIMLVCGLTIYFIFVNLGARNIKPDIFLTDLKVFSISLVIITIILFEKAYHRDNDEYAILGIEILITAIVTLISIYIYILYREMYDWFIYTFSMLLIIYYLIKNIIIYILGKKNYKNSISDVKEIVDE